MRSLAQPQMCLRMKQDQPSQCMTHSQQHRLRRQQRSTRPPPALRPLPCVTSRGWVSRR